MVKKLLLPLVILTVTSALCGCAYRASATAALKENVACLAYGELGASW
jgi:hypothetical protein